MALTATASVANDLATKLDAFRGIIAKNVGDVPGVFQVFQDGFIGLALLPDNTEKQSENAHQVLLAIEILIENEEGPFAGPWR